MMDITTDEAVHSELLLLQECDALTFVLPSDPLGERWVLGLPGDQMVTFNGEEARAFLLGSGVIATAIAEKVGLRL